ncbi:MAG TPA: D-glycero-beta-D-manno-heptose 1-phosphate adenylyltransferase [Cyclobacteriaceae bacterium]|nr:D-glycero-beta-D-manno-heptose 1-phosphate adenylyltransferase [Cyclobacteriaceae bacterium]
MRVSQNKIYTLNLLKEELKSWKQAGNVVVFTNGCFDIIHLGHVDYLEKARLLGNRLVIGLNSDSSIRRLKGSGRPILDENARSRIMASFEFIDAVTLFSEDTPFNLIREVKPDILVKGNDYNPENIVGADFVKSYGGKVITIELIPGYSTSGIVKKIKEN